MSRIQSNKNRLKITRTTNSVSKADYTSQITEKKSEITTLTTETASIQKTIEEQKNTLKEKRAALKKAEKELSKLEAKKAVSVIFNIWIAANVDILKGVHITSENVIAYRSCVIKSIEEEKRLIGGYPEKFIRKYYLGKINIV